MNRNWHYSLRGALAIIIGHTLCVGEVRADLLAQWHFDEPSGQTASNAVSQFYGTLSPTGAGFVTGGISGNAVSLDRSQNGWVNLANTLAFASGDFSIVLWVKTTATENDTIALGKHEAFSENGYFIAINPTGGGGSPNKATFVVSEFVSQAVISSNTVNDGTWHQLACVYQAGGSHGIYVDGAPAEATGTSHPMVLNSAPLLIGGVNVSGVASGRYTGLVDEVQVHDQALSVGDVDYLFAHPSENAARPRLTISLTTTNAVVISWPAFADGFSLQENSNLTTANWTAAPQNVLSKSTSRFILVNPAPGNRFYRLSTP